MIVFAPGSPLWNVAGHAGWLTAPVIRLTEGCVLITPLLVLWASWLRPAGLRCGVAAVLGLVMTYVAVQAIRAHSSVNRPFVAYGFRALYPHYPNTSFPSLTTAVFAVVAVPVFLAWRRLGWVLAAIAAEVGFGCVYVGVHYVTDVLAAAAIGVLCGLAAWVALGLRPAARLLARADRGLRRAHLRSSRMTELATAAEPGSATG